MQREAALLVEGRDIARGEGRGFGVWLSDEGDAKAVAVADEGNVERGVVAEMADRGVVPEDHESVGARDPIVGEITGAGDFFAQRGGELGDFSFEIGKAVCGEFEEIVSADEETAQEALPRGVWGVAAEDVDDGFGLNDACADATAISLWALQGIGGAEFQFDPRTQRFGVVIASPRGENGGGEGEGVNHFLKKIRRFGGHESPPQ